MHTDHLPGPVMQRAALLRRVFTRGLGCGLDQSVEGIGTDAEGGGGAAAREVPCLPQEGVRDDGQLCPLSSHLACPSLPARKELIF